MSLGSYEKIQDVMVSLCLPYSDVVLLVLLHAVLFTLYLPSQHALQYGCKSTVVLGGGKCGRSAGGSATCDTGLLG